MDADWPNRLDKAELIALVLAQAEQIRVLSEQNTALAARVAALEARLAVPPKTPTNSSVPPSKGQKANRPETGRKRRVMSQTCLRHGAGRAWPVRCAQNPTMSGRSMPSAAIAELACRLPISPASPLTTTSICRPSNR